MNAGRASDVPRVLLDTSVLHHSRAIRRVLAPRQKRLNWGGDLIELTVHEPAIEDRTQRLNERNRREIALLPQIASLATTAQITLLLHIETELALWGQPRTAGVLFFDAPISRIWQKPLPRTISIGLAALDQQTAFLRGIKEPRYRELRKACGAESDTGVGRQLRDAFHVWAAESEEADFVLTTDLKLADDLERRRKTRTRYLPRVLVLCPSKLLAFINRRANA